MDYRKTTDYLTELKNDILNEEVFLKKSTEAYDILTGKAPPLTTQLKPPEIKMKETFDLMKKLRTLLVQILDRNTDFTTALEFIQTLMPLERFYANSNNFIKDYGKDMSIEEFKTKMRVFAKKINDITNEEIKSAIQSGSAKTVEEVGKVAQEAIRIREETKISADVLSRLGRTLPSELIKEELKKLPLPFDDICKELKDLYILLTEDNVEPDFTQQNFPLLYTLFLEAQRDFPNRYMTVFSNLIMDYINSCDFDDEGKKKLNKYFRFIFLGKPLLLKSIAPLTEEAPLEEKELTEEELKDLKKLKDEIIEIQKEITINNANIRKLKKEVANIDKMPPRKITMEILRERASIVDEINRRDEFNNDLKTALEEVKTNIKTIEKPEREETETEAKTKEFKRVVEERIIEGKKGRGRPKKEGPKIEEVRGPVGRPIGSVIKKPKEEYLSEYKTSVEEERNPKGKVELIGAILTSLSESERTDEKIKELENTSNRQLNKVYNEMVRKSKGEQRGRPRKEKPKSPKEEEKPKSPKEEELPEELAAIFEEVESESSRKSSLSETPKIEMTDNQRKRFEGLIDNIGKLTKDNTYKDDYITRILELTPESDRELVFDKVRRIKKRQDVIDYYNSMEKEIVELPERPKSRSPKEKKLKRREAGEEEKVSIEDKQLAIDSLVRVGEEMVKAKHTPVSPITKKAYALYLTPPEKRLEEFDTLTLKEDVPENFEIEYQRILREYKPRGGALKGKSKKPKKKLIKKKRITLGGSLSQENKVIKPKQRIRLKEPVGEKYLTFGNYIIPRKQLDNFYFSLRFPERPKKQVEFFQNILVSSDFKDLILEVCLNGSGLNKVKPLYDALDEQEKELFDNALQYSKLDKKEGNDFYKHKKLTDKEKNAIISRFKLLRGSILAGNNNDDLIKELKLLLFKMMAMNIINKKDATDIMVYLLSI